MASFSTYRHGTRRVATAFLIVIGVAPIALTPAQAAVCTLTCPADISVNTQDPQGVVVNYDPPMATGCNTIEQTQGLASGDVFPPGTTRVGFRDQVETGITCSFTHLALGSSLE